MKQQVKDIVSKVNLVFAAMGIALSVVFSGMLLAAPGVGAAPGDCESTEGGAGLSIQNGIDCGSSEDQQGSLFGSEGVFTTVTNVLLFLIGAISVIMLIFGGIKYTISNGDPGAVTKAKDTIMYAVIGIIVALLAYAIVNFVVGAFQTN